MKSISISNNYQDMGEFITQLHPEAKNSMPRSLDFTVMKPAGNDTGLFPGVIRDGAQRKQIGDALQGVYPNIEQVGFVNLDPKNAELMMAGGEFCGNATRSTAYLALKGRPGEIQIKVSGVKNKLRAGVTPTGEAFSQMPIYPEPSRIKPDPKNPGNVTVEMEGITHYVDFNAGQIKGLSEDEIKTKARGEMAKRGIDKGPACGIIYTEKNGDNLVIYPVVYVRDADTLYYETACGSGTTALGLTLAQQKGESVKDVPIIQPSGMTIKFSVDYDGQKFGYAQISGPIAQLNEGTLETTKGISYTVEQVTSEKKLQNTLKTLELRDAYRDAFGRPPYNEQFTDSEIDNMFRDYLHSGHVFVAMAEGKVIAFSATQPLSSEPEVGAILTAQAGINPESWYIPDLGVKAAYENRGVGKTLMQRALDAVPGDKAITLRTSVDNVASQRLYTKLGFKVVPGLYQNKTQTRTDGQEATDQRLFMVLDRNAQSTDTSIIRPPKSFFRRRLTRLFGDHTA